MPNKKIYDLPRAASITGNEVLPLTTQADNTAADLNFISAWFNAKPTAYNFGALADDPQVSPFDGGPVPLGAQYYNTTLNAIRAFGDSGWFTPNLDAAIFAAATGAQLVGTPEGTVQDALNGRPTAVALAASGGAATVGYRHTQGTATTTTAKKLDAIIAPVDKGGSDLPVVEVRQRLNSAQNRNIIWVPHANDIHPDLNACTIFGGGDTLQRHLIGYSLNPQMFNGAGGVFVWPHLPTTTLSRLRLIKIDAGGTQTILALTTGWSGTIGASDVTISLVAALIAGERLYVEDLDAKVPYSGASSNYSAIGSGYDCVVENGPMHIAMGAHHRIFGGDGGHSAIFGGSYNQIWTGAYHVIVGGTQSEISGGATLGSAVLGGIRGRVTGSSSVAVGGNGLQVSGSYAAGLGGYQNVVSGLGASATGYQNAASGSYSWVVGRENKASGQYSVVAGYKNQANHQYTDIRNGYAGVTMYHGQQVDWVSRQFSEGIGPNTGAWKMPLTAFSQTSPISLAVFASGATTIPITAGQVWKAKLTVIQGPAARAKFWVVDFICTSEGFLEAPVVTIQDPNSRAADNIAVAIVAGSLTVEATFAAFGTNTFQYFGWLEVLSIG